MLLNFLFFISLLSLFIQFIIIDSKGVIIPTAIIIIGVVLGQNLKDLNFGV